MNPSKRHALTLLALLVAGAGLTSTAQAAEVEVRTRTLMLGRAETPGVSATWPIYQWVEVAGRDSSVPGLSAHASLWGTVALDGSGVDLPSDGRLAGDLNLLYAAYRDPKARFALKIGRQLILGGAGTGFFGHIDGLWGRTSLAGFEIEGYAGRVVTARWNNLSQADWLAGGRIGYRRWGRVQGGVSFLQARNDLRIAREFLGADLSIARWKGLDATAFASFDLIQPGLAETTVTGRYQPRRDLNVGVRLHQASPSRLLDQSSIFSVFGLGNYAESGLFGDYRLNDQWQVGAEYSTVFFPGENGQGFADTLGQRARISLTARPRADLWLRLALERLPTEDNGYTGIRLATRWNPGGRFSASAEFLAYFYDEAPVRRDQTRTSSLTANLFAEFEMREGLQIGLGGQAGQGAFADLDARLLLRVTWAGSFGQSGPGGSK